MKKIIIMAKLIFLELIKPLNYLISFIVGLIINLITTGYIFSNLTPFLVPIFVQSFSKAAVMFKNRKKDILLLLPQENNDPAFVMDENGNIVAAAGKTEHLFKEHGIKKLSDLITLRDKKLKNEDQVFSIKLKKWYSASIKVVNNNSLVWLHDITLSRNLDLKLEVQKHFSNDILNSLDDLIYTNDVYDRLSALVLKKDYSGLFITQLNYSGSLNGHAYRIDNGVLVKSESIAISSDSSAPINISRQKNKIVTDSKSNYNNQTEFESIYPFDNKIKEFMGFDITNFINYHKENISIITFNKKSEITSYDLKAMEALLDNTRIISTLIDMAKKNDLRFLEAIDGLCAAAEFSDEITGQHIYRVNYYSELIARELNLDEKTSVWIGQVAAIHDIGKVAIPDIIKIDRIYTPAERELMQMHPIYGAQIIEKMISRGVEDDPRLELAKKISLLHHQEWSGSGYPALINTNGNMVEELSTEPGFYSKCRPLKADEIPIECLIVSLADRYDALRSPRQYKDGFSHEKTLNILTTDDRTGRSGEDIFGPVVFKAFLKLHKQMEEIYNRMSS
ncbi:MAG: HD domain-containing protein [Spirochaetaceae bacterium]